MPTVPYATVVTAPTDLEIVFTRTFDAPRQLVFDAWTKPEHPPRWMLGPNGWTMPICEIDLRTGGKWHFSWRKDDGTELEMYGEYYEIAPPGRLVFTEWWGKGWPETLVTMVFTEVDGKSTLKCTILYPTKEARDAALNSGMKEGVGLSYNRLAEFLKTLV